MSTINLYVRPRMRYATRLPGAPDPRSLALGFAPRNAFEDAHTDLLSTCLALQMTKRKNHGETSIRTTSGECNHDMHPAVVVRYSSETIRTSSNYSVSATHSERPPKPSTIRRCFPPSRLEHAHQRTGGKSQRLVIATNLLDLLLDFLFEWSCCERTTSELANAVSHLNEPRMHLNEI